MDPIIQANLPEFKSVCVPNKDYNNIDKITFTQNINQIFEDTIHWKKNLFSVPTGQAGKDFVKLMTDWVQKFNTDSTFQYLAMKVINILPNMMLQKPSATSKIIPKHCNFACRCGVKEKSYKYGGTTR